MENCVEYVLGIMQHCTYKTDLCTHPTQQHSTQCCNRKLFCEIAQIFKRPLVSPVSPASTTSSVAVVPVVIVNVVDVGVTGVILQKNTQWSSSSLHFV